MDFSSGDREHNFQSQSSQQPMEENADQSNEAGLENNVDMETETESELPPPVPSIEESEEDEYLLPSLADNHLHEIRLRAEPTTLSEVKQLFSNTNEVSKNRQCSVCSCLLNASTFLIKCVNR